MAKQEVDTKTYSIPVPLELDDLVQKRMKDGGFNSVAEYVRGAMRADLERAARQGLEAKLLEAVKSGDYGEVDEAFWAKLRNVASTPKKKPKKRGPR